MLYTHDFSLVAETRKELQHMLDVVDRACAQWGMQISVSKTKILGVEEQRTDQQTMNQPFITLQGQALEVVKSFSYLGSAVWQSAKVEKEVTIRLKKARKVYQIWRRKEVSPMFLGAGTLERPLKCELSSYTGYVDPLVQCRDLASGASRDQKTEDVSNAVPARHPWAHTVGQAKKCRRCEAGRELPVVEQLKQRQLQ